VPEGQHDSDRSPSAETDPAVLGRRFGLGAYESTCGDEIYSPSRGRGRVLLGLAAFMVPFSQIPTIAGNVVVGLILAGPFVVLPAATGLVLLGRSRLLRTDRTFWFSDGFIRLLGDGSEPQVVRWHDAAWLGVTVYWSDESAARVTSATVCDRSGTQMTIVAEKTATALVERADRLLVPRVVPGLIDAFDNGERVEFGRLGIDHAGITDTGTAPPVFISWAAIRYIDIEARLEISVYRRGNRTRHWVNLGTVPNAFFAWHVIEHAAARADVPVRYSEEGRLPRRVPFQR
jgi:hypothetical protein